MWFDKHDPRALFMDRRRETHVDTYPCGTKTNVIDPCLVGDFSKMDFPDESFRLVVFDPPHIEQTGVSQITKKYGSLQGDWREMLRAGFAECLRVLKPEGVLIFKWNECRFPVKDILALTDAKPLFGHKSGKKMQTHWVAFLKQNAGICDRAITDIRSKISLIDQREKAADMIAKLNDEATATEALLRMYGWKEDESLQMFLHRTRQPADALRHSPEYMTKLLQDCEGELAKATAALKAIFDCTDPYADGVIDASAHDKLCNEISSLARPWARTHSEND